MQWRRWIKEHYRLLKDETRFTRRQSIIVCALAVLMLIGGAFNARERQLSRVEGARPAKTVISGRAKSPRKSSRPIAVHVSGAVAKAGLYKLRGGSRVADALAAAGGATGDADLDALNLAERLKDGRKIFLPLRAGPDAAADDGQDLKNGSARLNLNTASAEQLEELDGIGPVLAKRILDWRRRHGRFTSVAQVDQVEGIGPKKFSLIKDRLIAQ